MYHNKRFQIDLLFPFVAFNNQQMKDSSSGSFLLAKTAKFEDITHDLLSMDEAVLADLTNRLAKGETLKLTSDAKKDCYQLIKDLDHIGEKVDGSFAGKKLRRNEVWSLIVFKGGPLWYVMLNPTDVKHPIHLYWAGTQMKFIPDLPRSSEEKFKLIANNPVAGCASLTSWYATSSKIFLASEQITQAYLAKHLHIMAP